MTLRHNYFYKKWTKKGRISWDYLKGPSKNISFKILSQKWARRYNDEYLFSKLNTDPDNLIFFWFWFWSLPNVTWYSLFNYNDSLQRSTDWWCLKLRYQVQHWRIIINRSLYLNLPKWIYLNCIEFQCHLCDFLFTNLFVFQLLSEVLKIK